MCTRYLIEQARLRALAASLGLPAGAAAALAPRDRFNIAPGGPVAALRSLTGAFTPRWGFAVARHAAAVPDNLESDLGFEVPDEDARPAPSVVAPSSSAVLAPTLLVNARAETLAARAAFRDAFRRRRCLVPATGFYEWEKRGRARLPWLFRVGEDDAGGAFCFAGLWQKCADGRAEVVVITTAPNAVMAPIHHRMPALLTDADACRAWLDPQAGEADLLRLLAPADATRLRAIAVSPRMNRAAHDAPDCITPAAHGIASADADPEAGDGAELF